MNVTRIPDEAREIQLEAAKEICLDTKGLDCIVKPDMADVLLKIRHDGEGFLIRQGEEFTFCGKVYLYAKEACTVYCLFFRTL